MVDLAAATQAVVDQLVAGGVRATLDGRDANPPVVQVRPPILHYRFGRGIECEWQAWAMVPATGMRGDLLALGELVDATQAALAGAVVTATPDEAALADGSTVPMYRLTWNERIPA